MLKLRFTSNEPKTNAKSNRKNKNFLKTVSVQENIEISEHYLDESLDKNRI